MKTSSLEVRMATMERRLAALDGAIAALKVAIGTRDSPPLTPQTHRDLRGWRTIKELMAELRFPSEEACRMWLRRNGIANVRRGRVILVDGLDVDRVLRNVG
jgi:hypothetical protein